MYNLHQRYNRLSHGFQLLLLLGVPTILAFVIYQNNPLISDANLGLLIIIAMWWLLVFGWLNFYNQKEKLRKFAIEITQLPSDVRECIIEDINITLDPDCNYEQLSKSTYSKADLLVEQVNRKSRYTLNL